MTAYLSVANFSYFNVTNIQFSSIVSFVALMKSSSDVLLSWHISSPPSVKPPRTVTLYVDGVPPEGRKELDGRTNGLTNGWRDGRNDSSTDGLLDGTTDTEGLNDGVEKGIDDG